MCERFYLRLGLKFIRSTFSYMQKGTVVRKNEKGYGFIKVDGREKDLFFHANELQGLTWDDLNEGDVLEFEITEGPKGPNAVSVRRAGA